MFVHPNSPGIFTSAPKQIPQSEMQLCRVGVVLNGFDERVDGFVLLLIEQVVQALEVGARCLSVGNAHLAQIEARGNPAQRKSSR